MRLERQTLYCVRCINRKAKVWGGYVRYGRRGKVTAGWCSRCVKLADVDQGFRGHHIQGMGIGFAEVSR